MQIIYNNAKFWVKTQLGKLQKKKVRENKKFQLQFVKFLTFY